MGGPISSSSAAQGGFPTGRQLLIICTTMAAISLIALAIAISAIVYDAVKRRKLSFHAHLTLILLCLDFLDCTTMVASRHTYGIGWACNLQGISMTIVELSVVLWNGFMAYNLYSWLVVKTDTAILRKRINRVFLGIVSYAVVNAALFRVFYSKMGPSDFWCWFPAAKRLGRIYALHMYLYPVMIYITTVVLLVYCKVLRPKHRTISTRQALIRRRVSLRFVGYLLAFIIAWLPAIANRLAQVFLPRRVWWLVTIHVFAKPSMGLLDSLVYGSVYAVCKRRRKQRDPSQITLELARGYNPSSSREDEGGKGEEEEDDTYADDGTGDRILDDEEEERDGYALQRRQGEKVMGEEEKEEEMEMKKATFRGGVPASASIFVTTYNYANLHPGKTDLSLEQQQEGGGGGVASWIPLGHDLYIIGLQEVRGLSAFRSLVHRHLGGPGMYHMYTQEIGIAGQLGPSIAVTVLARAEHVAKGVVEMTAGLNKEGQQVLQGYNLGVCRGGNKGAVGLPFRFHGSSLAVVVAHLPADASGGRSRVVARDRALKELFSQARLTGEPFDLQLQFHHMILLGDLNYRVTGITPDEALHLIADEASHAAATTTIKATTATTKSMTSTTTWLEARYEALGPNAATALLPSRQQQQQQSKQDATTTTTGSNSNASCREWSSLVRVGREELMTAMQEGRVLHGFREGPIRFPPSYRRERGKSCGDYTDIQTLRAAFTTDDVNHHHHHHHHHHPAAGTSSSRMTSMTMRGTHLGAVNNKRSYIMAPTPPTSPALEQQPQEEQRGDGKDEELVDSDSDYDEDYEEEQEEEEDDDEEGEEAGEEGEVDVEKGLATTGRRPRDSRARVPSYTDRVLVHSLSDMSDLLTVEHYELCDTLVASDHRPVSAVLRLDVRRTQRLHAKVMRAYQPPPPTLRDEEALNTSSYTSDRSDQQDTTTTTFPVTTLQLPPPPPPAGVALVGGETAVTSTTTTPAGGAMSRTASEARVTTTTTTTIAGFSGLPSRSNSSVSSHLTSSPTFTNRGGGLAPSLLRAPLLPLAPSSDPPTLIVTIRVSDIVINLLPPLPPPSHAADPLSSAAAATTTDPPAPSSPPRLLSCCSSSRNSHNSSSNHSGVIAGSFSSTSFMRSSSSLSAATGGGGGAAAAGLLSSSRLVLAFPLQCENLMDTSERSLEYLHSELGHAWGTWSREGNAVLHNTMSCSYEEAVGRQRGMTLSTAVKVRGVMHALLKVIDANGQDVAEGVLCLPRPSQGPRDLCDVPLTLRTSHRGHLSATVEIVKVKLKANVKG